ncbi:MAG: AAA family ATPase [Candidatus Eremiobacteraeota bacterium]|nr:AAA family ATPase [Candidatus Eremiobacteraeota bacterium]MBC5804408.1 AAA family ATPase [Candidatus Eremiobacteraeota bacterium]MBC5821363.1 AAA family ATPase [Candidatus Eremiobacteraeota bacterium]
MVSERVVCPSFVGRIPELDHLLARRRLAADGFGGGVFVSGEAGIGKSRLLREFRARMTPAWTQLAGAACREFAQRPLEPLATILARLEPNERNPVGSKALSKSEQFDAIVATMARLAQRRVTAVLIEDLHWADIELVATLAELVQRSATQRMLFVITCRDNEISASHPLYVAIGKLLREPALSRLALEPLVGNELERFLSAALAQRAPLLPQTLVDIRRRCGGNPLFAEELLRHAVDHRRTGGTAAGRSLPHSLQAVVRERLNRCSPEERTFLGAAAIFGRRFRIDVLAETLGFSLDEHAEALRRLRGLQLIERIEGSAFGYAFRHALTRDVVYAEMPPTQTRPLHLRIAEAIERRADAQAYPEDLAHNFWEAGELARSAPYCERAGDAARDEVHAYEDAVGWFERAALAFGDESPDRGRVLAKASEVLIRCDELERALDLHQRAFEALRRAGDREGAVNARIITMGAVANGGRVDDAIALGESTLAFLASGPDDELHIRVLVRSAGVHGTWPHRRRPTHARASR